LCAPPSVVSRSGSALKGGVTSLGGKPVIVFAFADLFGDFGRESIQVYQTPWRVTYGGDRFSRGVRVLDERYRLRIDAQIIRVELTAGQHDGVVIEGVKVLSLACHSSAPYSTGNCRPPFIASPRMQAHA
jgi:hypothetical protein